MVKFRFRVSSKREFANSNMIEITFAMSQQEPFGAATQSVQSTAHLIAHMLRSEAAHFELGQEYEFAALPVKPAEATVS